MIEQMLRVIFPGLLLVAIGHAVQHKHLTKLYGSRLYVVLATVSPDLLPLNLVVFLLGVDAGAVFSTSSLPTNSPFQAIATEIGVDLGVLISVSILFHIWFLIHLQGKVSAAFEEEALKCEECLDDNLETHRFHSAVEVNSFLLQLFENIGKKYSRRLRMFTVYVLFLWLWFYFGPLWQ